MNSVSIRIGGRVQGVGFRPFVHSLARSLDIAGGVRNVAGGVEIEAEGEAAAVARFVAALRDQAPPLSSIERFVTAPQARRGFSGFAILPSAEGEAGPGARPVLTPDAATCEACLRELRDPTDRRHGYPFLNCTDCGPRLTILTGAPYDRARTTMAAFAMCEACRREYEDPADRRFHAQPVACPACGPALSFAGAGEPIARAVERLRAGEVIALKALGGYQLLCDARRPESVRVLRERKRRPAEPLALMVRDLDAARAIVELDPSSARWLRDRARPIVLLPRRPTEGGPVICEEVAPGLDELGVMLPSTPLHHLLLDALDEMPLVMTSANLHTEPMAYRDVDRPRVSGLADGVLDHDRPIAVRCDDSVLRVVDGATRPIRLARGFAPLTLALPHALAAPTLALGGHLKATFALGDGDRAVLGPHVGDLDHLAARESYELALERICALHRFVPERIVLDRHPDYATREVATRLAVPRWDEVPHHHAHAAACLAEHGVDGEAVAVVFDGAGYGGDGTVWGGEILVGRIAEMERAAWLRPVPLPGGERAMREPFRMALAHLVSAGLDPGPSLSAAGLDPARVAAVRQLAASPRCPRTSSVGRLFDAVAFLVGVAPSVSYEAEAPMRLEAAARRADERVAPYPFGWDGRRIDPAPMLAALLAERAAGAPVAHMAMRFHRGLAAAAAAAVVEVGGARGLSRAALSGGAMLNRVLDRELSGRLAEAGFAVLRHERVPPNDGGLAYGQLAIRAARDAEEM